MTAFVQCQGDCDKTTFDYDYYGIEDCRMLSFVPNGGAKSCNYGCLGYGSCVKACPFGAIHVENGVAKVDKEACKACGKCMEVCPKNLITLIPYDAKYAVACSSRIRAGDHEGLYGGLYRLSAVQEELSRRGGFHTGFQCDHRL